MEFCRIKKKGRTEGSEVNALGYCALLCRSSLFYMALCDIRCHL